MVVIAGSTIEDRGSLEYPINLRSTGTLIPCSLAYFNTAVAEVSLAVNMPSGTRDTINGYTQRSPAVILAEDIMGLKIFCRHPVIEYNGDIPVYKRLKMFVIGSIQRNGSYQRIYPVRIERVHQFFFEFVRIIGLAQQYMVPMLVEPILDHRDH